MEKNYVTSLNYAKKIRALKRLYSYHNLFNKFQYIVYPSESINISAFKFRRHPLRIKDRTNFFIKKKPAKRGRKFLTMRRFQNKKKRKK